MCHEASPLYRCCCRDIKWPWVAWNLALYYVYCLYNVWAVSKIQRRISQTRPWVAFCSLVDPATSRLLIYRYHWHFVLVVMLYRFHWQKWWLILDWRMSVLTRAMLSQARWLRQFHISPRTQPEWALSSCLTFYVVPLPVKYLMPISTAVQINNLFSLLLSMCGEGELGFNHLFCCIGLVT